MSETSTQALAALDARVAAMRAADDAVVALVAGRLDIVEIATADAEAAIDLIREVFTAQRPATSGAEVWERSAYGIWDIPDLPPSRRLTELRKALRGAKRWSTPTLRLRAQMLACWATQHSARRFALYYEARLSLPQSDPLAVMAEIVAPFDEADTLEAWVHGLLHK